MYYRLEGKTPVPCTLETWGPQNAENRRVASDTIGDATVSTVFLGIDHAYDGGPPLLAVRLAKGEAQP